jgi:hypothetical protein
MWQGAGRVELVVQQAAELQQPARAAGLEDREMEAAVAHLPGLRVLGNLFGIKSVEQVQR